jgi:chorismate lyase/3-hydroxybenzoate synthase
MRLAANRRITRRCDTMTGSLLTDAFELRPAVAAGSAVLGPLRSSYESADASLLLSQPDVLAVIGFGAAAPAHAGQRYLRVPLEPVTTPAPFEVWRTRGPVHHGHDGAVRWSGDGDYTFAALELDEAAHGGIGAAAAHAYRVLGTWLAAAATPHALRIWNFIDAINDGAGDAERYRLFCSGRAAGMRGVFDGGFPAATAIGVRDGRRVLRLYWIAARVPGAALENPRQLSAWRYPRQYGPTAPTFARAMHAPTASPQLFISGTAAIVGHASHHHGDFAAQLGETLTNFDSLLGAAGFATPLHFGARSLLKIYVRRAEDAAAAAGLLRERLPADTPLLLLHGDICRRELLIEIDGLQNA